jgi:hypothetical protein
MLRKCLLALPVIALLAGTSIALADYAAIAYSPKTRNYGYCYGYCCRPHAEAEALRRCSGEDKRIVVWAVNAWCALATGDGGTWGWGWSDSSAGDAKARALEECAKRGTGAHIVICVYSGD